MPKVLQYFQDRGYKPGMGIARAYATVLGGNPNVSLTAQDSFGTSVQSMLPRFLEGGDYYANAKRVLGDIPEDFGGTYASSSSTTSKKEPQATTQKPVTTEQRKKRATSLLSIMKDNILQQVLSNSLGRLF